MLQRVLDNFNYIIDVWWGVTLNNIFFIWRRLILDFLYIFFFKVMFELVELNNFFYIVINPEWDK